MSTRRTIPQPSQRANEPANRATTLERVSRRYCCFVKMLIVSLHIGVAYRARDG
ncbi:uncharacterized protein L969DRAFT_94063 [Mixia osmundae IAM 14324]|uniref:Uncharacterized protein n=1 Tax=Mixia osmundae (strain CBS 9802 / IAM 14324 / JCM 22182 / KY 12970) TaxID=764103 RepID=G7E8Z3_MIXOS|nr:uncharacterized protein L969DRAFT_94063 [Mixia osmundae IAM 14324]KEI40247.1 hypothetical protein L969DRAFT_94063 [Mixia osmundae IAM 14324]GAA99611.1 hypothetical protein E5Q_06312 [Mixia osmundae IAM 14324]